MELNSKEIFPDDDILIRYMGIKKYPHNVFNNGEPEDFPSTAIEIEMYKLYKCIWLNVDVKIDLSIILRIPEEKCLESIIDCLRIKAEIFYEQIIEMNYQEV
jgi:hypothetical protein